MSNYDPFTYNPQVAAFYGMASQHETAVERFATWMRNRWPDAYARMMAEKPELLNARRAIIAEKLTVPVETLQGLADGTAPTDGAVTTWGQDILDFFKEALPSYYQARAQKDLLEVNLRRAEQGLAPIDAGAIAPQVNVGASSDMMQLGYIAVGGLVLVGLFSAFSKRR